MFRCPGGVFVGKPPGQEHQPEQEQKGAAKLPKISVLVGVSERRLGTLWTLFWAFPVLHCPCVSLSGSRFCREAAGSGAAAGAGAKRSCKVAKNVGDSEGTLGTLWTLFWAFPVLHCPCVSLSGRRFCREAAGSGAAARAGAKRSCKVAKNIRFCKGFRTEVKHSLDAFLGVPRPSLPLFLWGVSGGRCVRAAGSGARRSCKVAKNINFCMGFRRGVRHSLDASLGLLRPSLPLCFAVREGRFCGVCLVVGASELQDQEQQLEQKQKGAKKWPRASVSSFYIGDQKGR